MEVIERTSRVNRAPMFWGLSFRVRRTSSRMTRKYREGSIACSKLDMQVKKSFSPAFVYWSLKVWHSSPLGSGERDSRLFISLDVCPFTSTYSNGKQNFFTGGVSRSMFTAGSRSMQVESGSFPELSEHILVISGSVGRNPFCNSPKARAAHPVSTNFDTL